MKMYRKKTKATMNDKVSSSYNKNTIFFTQITAILSFRVDKKQNFSKTFHNLSCKNNFVI